MLKKIDEQYLQNYKEKYVLNCPICHGKNPACSCWANYKLEIYKVSANIPIKFRHFKLKQMTHPQLTKQKEKIKDYIKSLATNRENGNCLYIYGQKGTAKTMCANIILMNAIKRGYKVFYFDSLKMISDMLKQDWIDNDDKLSNIISEYDFIVIDNFDSEDIPNTNVLSAIKYLFSIRSSNLLPTIFVAPVAIPKLTLPLEKSIIEYFSSNTTDIYFNGFDYEEAVIKKAKKK